MIFEKRIRLTVFFKLIFVVRNAWKKCSGDIFVGQETMTLS